MKNTTVDINKMDNAELIRERARVLARIRKYEKDELPSDAWLSEPKPDVCYVRDLEQLSNICKVQIALAAKDA